MSRLYFEKHDLKIKYMLTYFPCVFYSRGSSSRRLGNDRDSERSTERDRDRDSFSRWRDRQYYGPRRWLETALKDSWDKDPGKTKLTSSFLSKLNSFVCSKFCYFFQTFTLD